MSDNLEDLQYEYCQKKDTGKFLKAKYDALFKESDNMRVEIRGIEARREHEKSVLTTSVTVILLLVVVNIIISIIPTGTENVLSAIFTIFSVIVKDVGMLILIIYVIFTIYKLYRYVAGYIVPEKLKPYYMPGKNDVRPAYRVRYLENEIAVLRRKMVMLKEEIEQNEKRISELEEMGIK